MLTIINPGSGAVTDGTLEQAWENARRFVESMRKDDHIHDVVILDNPEYDDEGRWSFVLRHTLTGVEKVLHTHGLTEDQCRNDHMFWPRTYFDGSSTWTTTNETFLKAGYGVRIVKVEE